MATEFFAEGGKEVALKLTPSTSGDLRVYVDGEKIFDRKGEDDVYPTLPRVKEMRKIVREKLTAAVAAGD